MNPKKNKLKGKFNSSVGATKQAVGKALNDKGLESRGLAQQDKGDGQRTRGAIEEKLNKGAHALGDAIEKVGQKIGHLAD